MKTTVRVVERTAKLGLALASGAVALALVASPAAAQTQPKAAAPAAPAAKAPAAAPAAPAPAGKAAPAAAGQPQSFWVKLCDKTQLVAHEKDGKPTTTEKNICLTHHERLDGNSGMVIVSAALRHVEGAEKQHLMVMVPIAIGVAVPPGLRAAVFDKDSWAKIQNKEKVDEKALKPIDLKYTICHPAGCTAEVEASKEMVDLMTKGGGLVVQAWNAEAQPVPFLIPLDGFAAAQAGPPADSKLYGEERAKFFKMLRDRQEEALMKMVEAQKSQQRMAPDPKAGEAAPKKK